MSGEAGKRGSGAATALETGARLAKAEPLNAVLNWSQDALDAEGTRVDAMTTRGPLHAVPIALKDNIVTAEQPSTCGSRILEGYTSPFNATVVNRLRAAGAMIAAKANMDEFAMGSSTEHSAYGRVKHPLDPSRVPGGSSGGSAALVAAGVVPVALGSETGGSVRQPASFCGVVGVKPSYGRVSRYGLVAFGSSLDCISVFGRTVEDATGVLSVISGHDPLEATSVDQAPMIPETGFKSLKGIRIGLPREYFPPDLHPGVRAATDRSIAALKALGAEVRDISLPHSRFAVPTYYILAPAEAAANLARFDGVRYGPRHIEPPDGDVRALYQATRGKGFGPEVRRRILVGTYVLSAGYYDAYYGKAQRMRALIADDFTKAFAPRGVHFLFTPTTPTPAFVAGEKSEDPVAMYLADIFVSAVSLAGLPAMSLPIGRDQGLPIGGQIIAPYFQEPRMLALAAALESVVPGTAEVRS
ncbi:MAG TPA: Asp-tRNA(Asn)/Glu-tRNA(Gln) amidotransferase subunit GatA [Gemmatimonadales bacterium]|jgi:aspartyl-tRNA(Asn)/glutamyl-tRNA(Gln) amidotransferase subunit A|nr:Asp-tRNA(Asn)/Glu-tRNA(Gln) amidotransferase subunit GatA [Gemmatimonadales bacterium]